MQVADRSDVVIDRKYRIRYALRSYRGLPDDPIIYNSWCNQIRKVSPFQYWDGDRFRGYRHAVLAGLIDRCGAVIACNEETPNQVYGWACGEVTDDGHSILHMAYVREPHRGRDVGLRLARVVCPALSRSVVFYTHPTRSTHHFSRIWGLVYAPHLIQCWPPVTREQVQ